MSGRRQTDLCKKGFVGQLPSHAIAVNGFYPNGTAVERNSMYVHWSVFRTKSDKKRRQCKHLLFAAPTRCLLILIWCESKG